MHRLLERELMVAGSARKGDGSRDKDWSIRDSTNEVCATSHTKQPDVFVLSTDSDGSDSTQDMARGRPRLVMTWDLVESVVFCSRSFSAQAVQSSTLAWSVLLPAPELTSDNLNHE